MNSTPSKTFYKDGYFLSLENSKSLSKIADKAAQENEFGIACSLKILAAEESIKACSLITMHYSKDVEVKDLNKIFIDHKTKHEILSDTSTIINAVNDVSTTEFAVLDYIFETLEKFPTSDKNKIDEFFNAFSENFDWVRKVKNSDLKAEESKKYWQKANLQKNRGFYVDYGETKWYTPKDFTKEHYLEAQIHTDVLIENSEKIYDILFNSSSK